MSARLLLSLVRHQSTRRYRYAPLVTWSVMLVVALVASLPRRVPLPPSLFAPVKQSIEIVYRHGVTLRERPVDARFAREITFAEIPPSFVAALLAAEDKRFFEHRGVDWLAIGRATWSSIAKRRVTSGASTISQQLIKAAAPRRRTFRTKIVEALAAIRLEQLWSKEQILAAYLNRIDFGNANVGLAAAADYYFDKPLSDLSDAEAALLAGLPNNPRRLNPMTFPHAARHRQQTVLRRMHVNGMLDDERYQRARREPMRLRASRRLFRAPHFVDLVLRETRSLDAAEIRTTLDLDVNRAVERIVRKHVAALRIRNLQNAAVVVIDNSCGEVRALVGSEDYFSPDAGQVNGALSPRSAGSTLKPFVYLLAMENGATPATVFADTPVVYATPTGVYQPENYHRRCLGPVRLRFALGNSLNIPAVRALASMGSPSQLRDRLRAWGIGTLEKPAEFYGLGLALGNAEVRLIELANCYATLARLGRYQPLRIFPADSSGQASRVSVAPSAPSAHAWLIADILADNRARTFAFGPNSNLRFSFPFA